MGSKRRILTGITTTGTPHLGNYVGAIRPAIAASKKDDVESFYFLADYHALIKCDEPARIQQSTLEIAASWLACGLDPEKVYFYRQSDIPEIPELTWMLTCVTAKGLLNRAHAYKAANDTNREKGEDPDAGINAGLYMYPVLMAADILIFNAKQVPVGRDQIQHIEMARDIGQRFNHIYGGEYFTLPEAAIEDNVATLPGLDGRKMSKSYNNTIPLFQGGEKALRKAIMGMVTDATRPKNFEDAVGSAIYQLIAAFRNDPNLAIAIAKSMRELGEGWGALKEVAISSINAEIGDFRDKYEGLIARPDDIEDMLKTGARKARAQAQPFLDALRRAVGLRSLVGAASSYAFQEAYDAEAGSDEILPLEVKGPWTEGGSIGLTLTYSKRGYFRLENFPSKPDAGKTKKRLEAWDGIKVEVEKTDQQLYALFLYMDDVKIGTGVEKGSSEEAAQETMAVRQSVELRRVNEEKRAAEKQKSSP